MNKIIITPAIVILTLSLTSIAAAPVPATMSEPTYSISTDMLLRVNEAKGSAHLYAPSGNVSVNWTSTRSGSSAGLITVTRTKPSAVVQRSTLTRSGKIELVRVLRSTQKRIAGKPHVVNVDSIVKSISKAVQK